MNMLAHVTVYETPFWIIAVLLGMAIGAAVSTYLVARSNRNDPR